MPYSISTRDGITLNNIPDDVPADSPQLKQRVAEIRAQMQAGGGPGGEPAKAAGDASRGGVLSGIAMGLRDPIDAGAQMLRRVVPEPVAQAVDAAGNWLADRGLPVARSSGVAGVDEIVRKANTDYEANRAAAGREGFDAARLAGNVVNPVNAALPSAAGARTLGQLARVGATAGGVSAALQPVVGDTESFWTEKGKQVVGGAVTGGLMTPAVARGVEAAARGVQRVAAQAPSAISRVTQRGAPALATAADLDAAVSRILQAQGMQLQDVPPAIADSVRRQAAEALASRQTLNPAAALRRAQAEAVGLTGDAALTAGQLTRDPIQFATERNLSGIVLNTPQGPGNPLSARFAAQNRALQGLFDGAGASDAVDNTTAGARMLDALRAADAPVKRGVSDAYEAARGMASGRAAPLERGTFSEAANTALEQGQWGRFLPAEVRGLLNDISTGRTPFDVDAAVQIDGILSAAQRQAGKGTPQASAIGVVRDALHGTPLAATEFADGGAGQAAREAFDAARAAARSRFATIEQTPALAAALDGEAPDAFVRRYLLNADARDLASMAKVLEANPQAKQMARAQIADHLKRAAFGENAAGDKTFSPERYAAALRALGPERLKVFFDPAELVRFNLAAKVAADINSVPAGATNAVNYSNTGSALFNLLQRVSETPLLRQIPGARAIANQAGEIANERRIASALNPAAAVQAAQPAADLSPETVRALQRLFAPAAVAGGAAFGSGF